MTQNTINVIPEPFGVNADDLWQWYLFDPNHPDDPRLIITGDNEKIWKLGTKEFEFDEWLKHLDASDDDKVLIKLAYG